MAQIVNRIASISVEEQHWVIGWSLTLWQAKHKQNNDLEPFQFKQKRLLTCQEDFYDYSFLHFISNQNSGGISQSRWSDEGIHVQNPA